MAAVFILGCAEKNKQTKRQCSTVDSADDARTLAGVLLTDSLARRASDCDQNHREHSTNGMRCSILFCSYHHNGGRVVLAHLYPLAQDRTFELKVSPPQTRSCRQNEGGIKLRKCGAVAGSPDRGQNAPGERWGGVACPGTQTYISPTATAI